MITFIILTFILLSQLAISAYITASIELNDSNSGNNDADISQKLNLTSTVLSATFLIFIILAYYFKFIDYARAEILYIISIMLIAILLFVSYYYLEQQYKSKSGYKTALDNLKDNTVRVNHTELNISLAGGITTISLVALVTFVLLGKYYLAEQKIVTVKEPIYMNMQTSTVKKDIKEPDYMSDQSKNFII